jgi:hypothetical protein
MAKFENKLVNEKLVLEDCIGPAMGVDDADDGTTTGWFTICVGFTVPNETACAQQGEASKQPTKRDATQTPMRMICPPPPSRHQTRGGLWGQVCNLSK